MKFLNSSQICCNTILKEYLSFTIIHRLHSEILASININKTFNIVLWIGEKVYIKILFSQFSNIPTYIRVLEKLSDQHFNLLFFSNPRDKVMILVESRGKICPVVFLLLRTLSPGLKINITLKCWSNNFQTSLIYEIFRTTF